MFWHYELHRTTGMNLLAALVFDCLQLYGMNYDCSGNEPLCYLRHLDFTEPQAEPQTGIKFKLKHLTLFNMEWWPEGRVNV